MPGLHGEEILRLLKPLSLHQKIVVVSGSDSKDAEARVRNLGASGYIQKPVNTRALHGLLLGILQERVRQRAPEEAPRDLRFLGRLSTFVFVDPDPGVGKQAAAVRILVSLGSILYSLR